MKTQTHTPGPWELRHERHLGKTDHIIKIGTSAVYFQRGVGQTEAETVMNARLIASAPELLEIAHAYRNLLKSMSHSDGEVATFNHIESVLAKAEGRI